MADNLAIEVVEVAPSQRAAIACQLLLDRSRRPAIVYAPTRAQTTGLAADLGQHFPCAAYHAGLDAEHRQRVQQEFLAGRFEVMVATIAFGMGIDKLDLRTVIHTALPGSLEAYYQEIGRAGRDGKPSRTILMHAWADRRTHDFFFERDYPDVSFLDTLFAQLRPDPQEKSALQRRLRNMSGEFDKALEKLWIHGGAVVDFAENISRGHDHWREPYIAQGDQKKQQLELMQRYAESSQCRMAALVRHFGDLTDARKPCGKCDFCAPSDCIGQRFRPATAPEIAAAACIVAGLRVEGAKATGKLHSELCPQGQLSRDSFEEVLGAIARAGLVRLAAPKLRLPPREWKKRFAGGGGRKPGGAACRRSASSATRRYKRSPPGAPPAPQSCWRFPESESVPSRNTGPRSIAFWEPPHRHPVRRAARGQL